MTDTRGFLWAHIWEALLFASKSLLSVLWFLLWA